ncbi:MAG: hypothetical protein GX860_11435 [Alcaligenaceae bacterium]|nr:hypothetical protein [Alcaligenaceae bacterium]
MVGIAMKIIKNDDVNLKVISEATEAQSPKSEITIEGTKLKLIINGVDLEACIQYDECYLVFTTDDCPFEESLNIYLLSGENEIIDSATAFWPYGTGSFKLLGITDPDLVQFKFFGDKDWQIKIFKSKRFYIPYISEPSGVWRKIKFWRSFGVSEVSSQ